MFFFQNRTNQTVLDIDVLEAGRMLDAKWLLEETTDDGTNGESMGKLYVYV